MRTRLLNLPLILLPVVTAVAGAQQKVDIRRASTPNVSVRLSGAFSSLSVSAWPQDSIALTGTTGPGTRLDGGPLSFTGAVSGMKFYVETSSDAGLAGTRLELRVPRNARVWVKAGSANVDVSGVAGGLDLNIIGGSVRVNGKPSELLVESMDGAVTFSGFAEFARIKTATGDIVVDGGGEDLSFTSVSGAIRGANGERAIQRARFETVTGPITFAGNLPRGAELRFDTHSGPIELRLSRSSAVEVDAATITGSIENGWSSTRPIAGREGRGMELATSSGMGAARVVVRSFKGNVKLVTN